MDDMTLAVHDGSGMVNTPSESEDAVNIIREKTFTDELRDLVRKATENDQTESSVEKEEVIRELYRLFYLAKNLEDNLDINSAFNPMELWYHGEERLPEAAAACIKNLLAKYGFSSFALLRFCAEQRAFIPGFSTLSIGGENIAMGLTDPLYRDIMGSENGLILTPEEINGNQCLEKQYSSPDVDENNPVYFASLHFFTGKIVDELSFAAEKGAPHESLDLSSILMIELPEKRSLADAEAISAMIHRQLAVPLYIFEFAGNDEALSLHDDIYPLSSTCAGFIHLSQMDQGRAGLIVSMERKGTPESYYLFRHFIASASGGLPSLKLLIQPLASKAYMSIHENDIPALEVVISQFVSLAELGLTVKVFKGKDRFKTGDILQALFSP